MWGGGIPSDQDFAGVGFQVQGEHGLVVVHIDFDLRECSAKRDTLGEYCSKVNELMAGEKERRRMYLLLALIVTDSKGIPNFHFGAVLTSDTQ